MRIVAGEYRGRPLKAPRGDATRPTTDRVREALMSVVASARGGFGDAVVLDAFAGSGALGLESLSRGAASVHFFERDGASMRTLADNVKTLGIETLGRGARARRLVSRSLSRCPRMRVPGVPCPHNRIARRLPAELAVQREIEPRPECRVFRAVGATNRLSFGEACFERPLSTRRHPCSSPCSFLVPAIFAAKFATFVKMPSQMGRCDTLGVGIGIRL